MIKASRNFGSSKSAPAVITRSPNSGLWNSRPGNSCGNFEKRSGIGCASSHSPAGAIRPRRSTSRGAIAAISAANAAQRMADQDRPVEPQRVQNVERMQGDVEHVAQALGPFRIAVTRQKRGKDVPVPGECRQKRVVLGEPTGTV